MFCTISRVLLPFIKGTAPTDIFRRSPGIHNLPPICIAPLGAEQKSNEWMERKDDDGD